MTIAKAAKKHNLTPDTLRYYESVVIPHVNRTSGGIRDYQEEDYRWIEFINRIRRAALHANLELA